MAAQIFDEQPELVIQKAQVETYDSNQQHTTRSSGFTVSVCGQQAYHSQIRVMVHIKPTSAKNTTTKNAKTEDTHHRHHKNPFL